MGESIDAYTEYSNRRTEILAALSRCEKRMSRFFLIERCFNGLVVVGGLTALIGIAAGRPNIPVIGAGGVVIISVLWHVVSPKHFLDRVCDERTTIRRHLDALDRAWDEWMTSSRIGLRLADPTDA